MTSTAAKVRDIIRENVRLGFPAGTLVPDFKDSATLADLGLDSLEVVELVIAVEDPFPGMRLQPLDTRWGIATTVAEAIADVEKDVGRGDKHMMKVTRIALGRSAGTLELAIGGSPADTQVWFADIRSRLEAPGWQTMANAPKDRPILIRFEHPNYALAEGGEKLRWEEVCVAHWIDHNAGGWTWYGLLGAATHWMDIPSIKGLGK